VQVGATNRVYARDLSLLLERGDRAGLAALRRRRAGWLLPVLALLLAVAFGFTDALLGLFRPEFVAPGRVALRLLAVAAALSMALALAPTMLKFRRRHRPVLVAVGLAALLQAVLLALLVPRFGATGAAAAYAAATALLYGGLAVVAGRPTAAG
jgi:O-antigen/teichoic acid export membrane protein